MAGGSIVFYDCGGGEDEFQDGEGGYVGKAAGVKSVAVKAGTTNKIDAISSHENGLKADYGANR